MLKIPANQYDRKQAELLEWLTNFYDYDFYEGRPKHIRIKAIYGEYQPLPRKHPRQDELNQEKINDYTSFTIAALGTEFKPNSKTRIAREAISNFGFTKYHHSNAKAVAQRFIKRPFEAYGETNNKHVWVWYNTYTPLNQKELNEWIEILRQERIDEEHAANAFYKAAEGEDVSKELSAYQKARDRIKALYDDNFPVRVREWRLHTSSIRDKE